MQSGLPTVLALSTYFVNILERETEKNFMKVSPYAKKGDIFSHDIVLIPVLHNKHFSLYVSILLHQTLFFSLYVNMYYITQYPYYYYQ